MSAQAERGNWIYIGPTIPPLGLQRHTLYRSSALPSALELIAAQKPAVRALFIPIDELAAAKRKLATSGSLEHTANQDMLGIAKTTPH
jgi:hypothetical protein